MYSIKDRISYSMINEDGKLGIPGVINFFQDCCLFHSHDVGLTVPVIQARKHAWLLSSWHIVFRRMPEMGENVNIQTWPYEFKSIYGMRNFLLETEEKEPLAYADSYWFYFDFEKGRPVKPDTEETDRYGMGEKYPMEYLPRHIKLPESEVFHEKIMIYQNQLDTNHHVNNGEYVRISCNYLPKDIAISDLRVEYMLAAHLGDTLYAYTTETNTHFYVILRNPEGKLHSACEFKKGTP